MIQDWEGLCRLFWKQLLQLSELFLHRDKNKPYADWKGHNTLDYSSVKGQHDLCDQPTCYQPFFDRSDANVSFY